MIIYLLSLLFSFNLMADCNTAITRTNFSPNTVLTASDLNSQFNTAYTAINAEVDGDCITDDTVTLAKLNAAELAPILNGIQRGCAVEYDSVSAVNVDDCVLTIGGSSISTTSATNVAFGCGSCSAETSSTFYYVYALTTSTGSTLNLTISTTAPDSNGLDGSGNIVLGRFYNNASSNIDQYSIDQFKVNGFVAQSTDWINAGAITIGATTTPPTKATTVDVDFFRWKRNGRYMDAHYQYYAASSAGAAAGSGMYLWDILSGYLMDSWVTFDTALTNLTFGTRIGHCQFATAAAISVGGAYAYDNNTFILSSESGGRIDSASFSLSNNGQMYNCVFKIPIIGWKETGEI